MPDTGLTFEMVDRDGAIAGAADIVTRPTFTEAA
jgi:hypothetical protein